MTDDGVHCARRREDEDGCAQVKAGAEPIHCAQSMGAFGRGAHYHSSSEEPPRVDTAEEPLYGIGVRMA